MNGSLTGACVCRGDYRLRDGTYLGGCRYYRGNPNGTQYECENECDREGYKYSSLFKSTTGGMIKISETDACKYGCRIRGIYHFVSVFG